MKMFVVYEYEPITPYITEIVKAFYTKEGAEQFIAEQEHRAFAVEEVEVGL